MLLLLLLLSFRVAVTAWPRRARVCLVFVTLEQSSDRGPGFFFFCGAICVTPTTHARALESCSSSMPQNKNSNNR